MNERLEHLMYSSGLTASGCWDEMDDYAREAIEKFAELIVQECCNRLGEETIRHDGYGYNQHELYRRLREHFGVAE